MKENNKIITIDNYGEKNKSIQIRIINFHKQTSISYWY